MAKVRRGHKRRFRDLWRLFFPFGLLALGSACYASISDQDRAALQTAEKLSESAYCRLTRADLDTDAGDVAAARALERGSHAELAAVLRRSGVADAGASCFP